MKTMHKDSGASLLEFALAAAILTSVFIAGGIVYQNATQSRFNASVNAISEPADEDSNAPFSDEYTGLCLKSYSDDSGGNLDQEVCF